MKIFIVGSGKLANAILNANMLVNACEIMKWDITSPSLSEKSIVIHAGSGRQLEECIGFCKRTDSVLIELSTGLETEKMHPDFTLIVCPNTSILLLKVMNMTKHYGSYFKDYKISITESHQSTKTSAPGTAIGFANYLNVPIDGIVSIRDPERQAKNIGIPSVFLESHAYHKIVIEDGVDKVTIETMVLGHDSYSAGIRKIIDMVLNHDLQRKRYTILELIDQSLL